MTARVLTEESVEHLDVDEHPDYEEPKIKREGIDRPNLDTDDSKL